MLEIGYNLSMEASLLSFPLLAVLLNFEASLRFDKSLSDLLSMVGVFLDVLDSMHHNKLPLR